MQFEQIRFFVSANWCPQAFLIWWKKKSQSCLILHTKYSKYPDSFVLHPIFSRKKDLGLLSVIPQIPSLLVPRTVKPWCMCLSAAQRCVLIKYCPATIQYPSCKDAKDVWNMYSSPHAPYPSVLDFWKIEFETFFKNQIGRSWFLVYFELDFYCLCSLQKSSSK